jgi:hypothetical protein
MAIDPRLLATPIGAVIGLVVARKVLRPEDRTNRNLAIGAGLGGGAGFLTGQFLQSDALALRNPTNASYHRYVRNKMPVGEASSGEIAALHKLNPLYGKTPAKGGGPLTRARRNLIGRVRGDSDQRAVRLARVQVFDRALASNPNMSTNSRNVLLRSRSENQEKADQLGSAISWKSMRSQGPLAVWDTLAEYISALVR